MGADLTAADLRRAWAIVNGADLRGANLTGADLTEAILSYADLREALLAGANLSKTSLTGAKVTAKQVEYLKAEGITGFVVVD